MSGWFVYLLNCADGSLYTGISRDPREREATHNAGNGASYTRSRRPVELVYVEPVADRSAALRRELQLKSLTRRQKLELLRSRDGLSHDAPLITVGAFGAPHGFGTRAGGVSEGPYAGLNVGARTADDPAAVEENRSIFRSWFGENVRLRPLEQVHGDRIVMAGEEELPEADAQLSDDPADLLLVGSADCLPLLFFDPGSGAVGAAHCGWRGTLAGLAAKVVVAMGRRFGSEPDRIRVAIGPGICRDCYEVGEDLVQRFIGSGFPAEVARQTNDGHWHLDLAAANEFMLQRAGVEPASILRAGGAGTPLCTSCEPALFYSHRRDRGITGRHWAAVRAAGGR
ncbi:MAG TPA: peptidoglycan editing factor PgeF [Trueperaceae bacterium]